jgi:prohibitin 2
MLTYASSPFGRVIVTQGPRRRLNIFILNQSEKEKTMRLIFGLILMTLGIFGGIWLSKVKNKMELSSRGSNSEEINVLVLRWVRIAVFLVVVPLGAILVIASGVRFISAGHVGVATLFGEVQPIVLSEGINFVNPLYDITQMTCRTQKYQKKYDAASKDLQAVHVEMALNFRINCAKAPDLYQRVGLDFGGVIIDPAAQEVLKANTALHVASEILHRRPLIKADVQKDLTIWLAKYGIILKEASLANIKFDPAYERAIEAKQIEEQKAEQKRYELVQAQRQAEIAAAQAKGFGDAAREKAKGEAEATKIRGDAESTYNQKVSASLTPTLIQQQYLMKWDGKLPQFSMGGGSGPGVLLNIPTTLAPSGK